MKNSLLIDLGQRSRILVFILVMFFVVAASAILRADAAAFDLTGPKVEVRVQREGHTLPISEVPNLQAGDRLWVHPDLPDTQSVRYLMVISFLRGSTNPPPDSWFTRVEAWTKQVHDEGVFVTVPEGAEEAVVFLAPETGGAFSTVRSAIRGKPGAFVRAAQDLEQASLDRQRLEKYLDSVREASSDPEQTKARATLLARSLNIRLDQQCFDKPSAQQVPCLTQNTDQLVLDDSHSQTMVSTLSSGPSSDLLVQVSATPTAGGGYYSAYVGAIVDVVRILGTAHTAQYQYIPALSLPKKDNLNLRLNYPPSFRNPKSVIVIALPLVVPAANPPMRALDGAQVFCVNKPSLVLPVDGAPLVFATELAHELVLHVETKSKSGIDLPAVPDPSRGGLVIDTKAMQAVDVEGELSGILRGVWGFRSFEGPRFRLRASTPEQWIVASKDASALIVGREDILHLQSPDACCVSAVSLRDEKGKITDARWEIAKPEELEVKVPLEKATAGALTVVVHKLGTRQPDEIPLHTYSEAGRLDAFNIHAGDSDGVIKGTRLDQVTSLEVDGLHFVPDGLSRANQQDELKVVSHEPSVSNRLQAGEPILIHVALKDGRALDLNTAVEGPRPRVNILSKNVQFDASSLPSTVRLENQDELPQDGRLNFFLKTQVPENFPPTEKIEVATADGSFSVLLSEKDGNLTAQDSKTVFAVLNPMKLLGPSAFGPLKFRPIAEGGIDGDWQPLITLVRVPVLEGIRCEPGAEKQCTLNGDKLFLIDAVSSDPDFSNSVTVPDGFGAGALTIPQPKGKTLYLKLRDDPSAVVTADVPVLNPQQQ
ncbi:MAG TPA: hypothetical protein VN901_24400 [Candidatus Acidoferrales bacterium]|nr:hypothetical protein [Candidatus Acidoferrales bacterium]